MDTFADNTRWFDRGMVFEEGSTKWYSDYDEVKAFNESVEKYMGLMSMDAVEGDNPPSFSYEFIRIGENYDDVETWFEGDNCEYRLGVHREITMEV